MDAIADLGSRCCDEPLGGLTDPQLDRAESLGATTGLADVRADGAVFLYGRLARHTVRWLVAADGTVLDTDRL